MGKKTRKSRNKKPASQQSDNNKSNNDEQLAIVPDTVIPAEGTVDDAISTPSPKTDDNVVDSTNDKDANVNTSERIDDDNTVQMIHSANDEGDLIKSPKQDTNINDQEVAIVVTNNTNGDNEVIDTTDDVTTKDNEKEPRPLVIAGPSGAGKPHTSFHLSPPHLIHECINNHCLDIMMDFVGDAYWYSHGNISIGSIWFLCIAHYP